MRAALATCAIVALAGCGLFRGPERASCPSDRTIVLASQDDIARFAGCERASGVIIRSGATLDLAPLNQLAEVTGDVTIGPTVGVDEIALTGLRTVGGAVHVAGNGSLVGLFLPRLERVGRLIVDGNAALTTISVPHLTDVAESIVVTDAPALELFDAGALVTIGNELVLGGVRKLTLLELPRLAHAAAIQVDGAPGLPDTAVAELKARVAH